MPSLEQIVAAGLGGRLDADDAVATANGASDVSQLLGWLAAFLPLAAQADFTNPNVSAMAGALGVPSDVQG